MKTKDLQLELNPLRDRYVAAQLAGDRRKALRLFVEAEANATLTFTQLRRVVQEAQREIGRLWQEGQINIAQEHMATAISQLVLAHLFHEDTPLPTNGKKVVVACVEGELHEFPARLTADGLDSAGFVVRFFGANMPVTSLLTAIADEKPDLVALSITMTFNIPVLRATVDLVREQEGKLPIVVGGHACEWDPWLAAEVGADGTGADAVQLVKVARRLLGLKP